MVYQQATIAPADSTYRWISSIAMDHQGDIAVGYSVSDATSIHPSIRYTSRQAGDPLNTMEDEVSMFVGVAGTGE